jgi:hypothetical protein
MLAYVLTAAVAFVCGYLWCLRTWSAWEMKPKQKVGKP